MSAPVLPPHVWPSPARRAGDVTLLQPFDRFTVGDTHTSRARTVTECDLAMFAALMGDATGRGRMLAAALLPLTYSIGLIANSYIGALRRVLDLCVGPPVKAGDTIHVKCQVERLGPWTEEYGLLTGCWAIVDQQGVAALSVRLEAVWRRAPL